MPGSVAPPLRVAIVTPAARGSRSGNRTTALRWAGLLRQLGVRARVRERWQREPDDLLMAVHLRKTAESVLAFARERPDARVAVLLAGTDVYPEFAPDADAMAVLERADAVIALQPRAAEVLPASLRGKVRTIIQSATAVPVMRERGHVRACVLAHLRPVKDPLLAFAALAHVPRSVPVRVTLAGRALNDELRDAAIEATRADPRCEWLGELPRAQAKVLLALSHVCIVPSGAEGGANVVSEALAAATPILATRIPGNTGLLGDDWPALFSPGNARELGDLLVKVATDSPFHQALTARTLALQHLVAPARERDALARLLADLFPR